MSQIKIIATDLDIQPILHQVLDNPHDWQMVSGLAKNNPNKIGGDQEPPGFLPLTMGVASPGEDIKNSEKQYIKKWGGTYRHETRTEAQELGWSIDQWI